MQAAKVIGSARATRKHDSLQGERLVIVQPLGVGDTADGPPLLVIDHFGARRNDHVIITSDGNHARETLKDQTTPARWTVMGWIDP